MSPPRPSNTALHRIGASGEAAFVAFLDEVSPTATRLLVDLLPAVPGFRKNSKIGVQRRKLALAKDFASNQNRNSRNRAHADRALYAFWRAWAEEHLGDRTSTATLLDAIEEIDEGSEAVAASEATERVVSLFSTLNTRSIENKCSRETIERLFTFSPFDESVEVRALIAEAKSSSEIEQDLVTAGLPQRLRQNEEQIRSLEHLVHQISMRFESSTIETGKFQKAVATFQAEISRLNTAHTEIRAALSAQADTVRSSEQVRASRRRDTDALFTEVNDRLSRFASEIKDSAQPLQSRVSQLEGAQSEIRTMLGAHTEAVQTNSNLVASIGRETEALSKKVDDALAQISTDAQSLAKIVEELAADSTVALTALERRLAIFEQDAEETAPEAGARGPSLQPVLAQPLRPRRLFVSVNEKVATLSSFEDAVAILAGNLERAGLKRLAARTFSEEICTATLIGQAVFFKGALATSVARLSALSFSGPNSARLPIPIGLTDGEALRAIGAIGSAAGSAVPAVAIEGVNRSALDVYADVIADLAAGKGR